MADSNLAAEVATTEILSQLSDSPTHDEIAKAVRGALKDGAPPLPDVVTVTVNLRRDAYVALEEIAQAHGTDVTEALHRAIATELAVVQAKTGPRARMRRSKS